MSKAIQLGQFFWLSKKDEMADFDAIRNKGVRPLEGVEAAKIHEAYKRGSQAEEKTREPVGFSIVAPDAFPHTLCAAAVFSDGSIQPFSIAHSVNPPTVRTRASDAMRRQIAGQIIEYKSRHFVSGETVCPVAGALINEQCEIDHYPITFTKTRDAFLAAIALRLEDVLVSARSRDGLHVMNSPVAGQWERFHLLHATLRVLSIHGHMTHTARGRK